MQQRTSLKSMLIATLFLFSPSITWGIDATIWITSNDSELRGSGQENRGDGRGIMVTGFGHNINRPIGGEGLVGARIQHAPLKILKAVDQTSIALYLSFIQSEIIAVTLRFYKPDTTGVNNNYYTIQLDGARISSITSTSGGNGAEQLEFVSFTYAKIHWIHEDSSTEFQADWYSPQ